MERPNLTIPICMHAWMNLKLDDLEIKDKYLSYVSRRGDQILTFSGIALDNDGEKICKRLSKFKIGQIIEVEAETNSYSSLKGVYKIVETKIPQREIIDKGRVIYRFSGILEPIY